jgi:hypothetical protein
MALSYIHLNNIKNLPLILLVISMKIISPFYIIFNKNNWFYNSETSSISYSDDMVSLKDVYLKVPLKDDLEYNEKLNGMIKNFITHLYNNFFKNTQRNISTNVFKLLKNKTESEIVFFKSVYIKDTTIYFEFTEVT